MNELEHFIAGRLVDYFAGASWSSADEFLDSANQAALLLTQDLANAGWDIVKS